MNVASTTIPHWAVSTRASGEVLTAGCNAGALELSVMGVPAGFTPAEVEGWLHDLAGVALETSSGDERVRAIPALLHHALTGLLFSQTELWSSAPVPGPCSAAFVALQGGAAFGWVGDARVTVTIDDVPAESPWVLVRDENGREARALVIAPGQSAQVTIEYWPESSPVGEASAAIVAEWTHAAHDARPPEHVNEPLPPAVPPEPMAASGPQAPPLALPAGLPTQQPGLAVAANEHAAPTQLGAEADAWIAPPTEMPAGVEVGTNVEAAIAAGELAARSDDAVPVAEAAADETEISAAQVEALEDLGEVQAPHPVARWLGRLMHWGRRPAPERAPVPAPEPEANPEDEHTPVSAYDSLLSERVPATVHTQTSLELAGTEGLAETDASDGVAYDAEVEALANEPERAPEPVAAATPQPAVVATPEPVVAVTPQPAVVATPEPAVAETPEPAVVATPEPAVAATPEPAVASLPVIAPAPVPGIAAAPSPAAEPVESESAHARAVAELRAADASTLPVLPVREVELPPSAPLHIEREPAGADDTFAMPRLPVREAPPTGPPMLRVAAAAAPPRIEPPPPAPAETAASAPPLAPRTLEPASAPPVLRVPHAPPPSAPPVLRVQVSGRPADAPPVLRVAPTAVPPPTIVPTPPVAPVIGEPAAYAPTETQTLSPTPRAWPVLPVQDAPRRLPPRAWAWGAVVLAVFAVGWLLGVLANPAREGPGPLTRVLRAVGLGPAHFDASVNSSPNGAWIAVDGKDLARRTPAEIELSPGPHTLTLTLPDLGSTQVQVRGQQGAKVAVNPPLNGALAVYASDPSVPISVMLDGRPVGYAPLQLESVAPGLHELQFSGPNMPAWAQTVQVGVRRTAQVVAHPMMAPSNGVIQVTATLNDERGATPLNGAQVWVDGELHGVTPTSLDLPRGPHSLRVTYKGETAPVQVIDLPGGNQRYASFAFGLDTPSPQVVLMGGVHPASRGQNAMVSAGLQGLTAGDVHEAWLHTQGAGGLWSRYPMTVMPGSAGPVVVAVFPSQAFDAQGQARWYVSATTNQGDECFSDMQVATLGAAVPAAPHHRRGPPAGNAKP